MSGHRKQHTRSSIYQWLYNEVAVASEILDVYSSSDAVFRRLNPFQYSEEVLELEDQLREEFWRVLRDNLTPKQLRMVELLAEGKTQTETSRELSCNQSSITKNLKGSKEIGPDGRIINGGIVKKIRAIVKDDERINEILRQIAELREDDLP